MNPNAKIYIAGHRGLVGSAIVRRLTASHPHILTRTHAELDLTNQAAVEVFFAAEKPEYVFLAAAKVGGILANNTYPADFIAINLAIQSNIIQAAHRHGVKRLLFLGSSCIYPRDCPQPMKEEYLLTGPLESTNRPYAVAKIAGIEMCWAYNRQYGTQYLAVMPTNLYGPGDNYDLNTSHVIPALIRKFHEAKLRGDKEVVVWGTGTPYREFLYSDDMADACVFLMNLDDARFQNVLDDGSGKLPPLVNIGTGVDLTIKELAECVGETVGFTGKIVFDASKPDGTPRKLLDVSRMNALGWHAGLNLQDGLKYAYRDFMQHSAH
ncbi:MAG: GDP-L-fucose synthase family protein [Sulfuriferula sp.]